MKRFQNYRIRNDDLRQPLVISKYLLYVIHTKSFRPKTTMEGGRYGEHGKGWGRRVTKNGSGRSLSACRPNGPCVIIITSAPMQKSYFYTLPFVPPRAFLDPHPHASALRISTYTHRTSIGYREGRPTTILFIFVRHHYLQQGWLGNVIKLLVAPVLGQKYLNQSWPPIFPLPSSATFPSRQPSYACFLTIMHPRGRP